MVTSFGPDLLTSCGNHENILSVGANYVVGIGGPCSTYNDWALYSRYPTEHRQALSNGCSNSSTSVTVTPTFVRPTPTSRVDDGGSSAKGIIALDLMVLMTTVVFML